MNMININFASSLDDIKESLKEVLGDYYGDIIDERISRTVFFYYVNYDALQSYYNDLCKTKMRELGLKFYHRFGIDTSSYNNKKLSEPFPEDLSNVTINLFGFFPFDDKSFSGIKSFLVDADSDNRDIIGARIGLLNYLRGTKEINKDNYKDFIKTDEFKELEIKIKEYLDYFQELKPEYEEYLNTISFYKKFLDEASIRKQKLMDECKEKMIRDLEFRFPAYLKAFIRVNRKTNNPLAAMFESDSLSSEFYIEYFGEQENEELKSDKTSNTVKDLIKEMRLVYFNSIGIKCDVHNPDEYDRVIEYANERGLIPSQRIVNMVKKYRELRYEEAHFRFYSQCEEFRKCFDGIPYSDELAKAIYSRVKKNDVCVTKASDDDGFLRSVFFSLKPNTLGKVDFMFIHELVHAIESSYFDGKHYCGFDILSDKNEMSEINPDYRKYERFNETITDLIAIEVRENLVSKGIYIAQDEKYWIRDVNDFNTSSIIKDMVRPLFDSYRDVIIHARISGDMQSLYDAIGKDNYEEINELVSRVDSLVFDGLKGKLDRNLEDDPKVIEYRECMFRLESVYERIAHLNAIPKM